MARTTKKDIYEKYGIKFDGKKIFCDPLNMWINPVLTYGTNTKVGKAWVWSLMHGNETFTTKNVHKKVAELMKKANVESVCGSCPCHCQGCYCDNGCYNFPDNKVRAIRNLILAKYYSEWLERAIEAQIEAEKATMVRIHGQGDFTVNDGYIAMWDRITDMFSESSDFWTYTKDEKALAVFEGKKNVSIVPSKTPYGFNYGTAKELIYRKQKLENDGFRVHICACGTRYEKHCAECKHGCKAIGKECDYVLFIKHSVKDYDFDTDNSEEKKMVLDIVRSQEN